MSLSVLRIDASARRTGSATRDLTDRIVDDLSPDRITVRDLAETALPQIDESWIEANFTAASDRTDEQATRLELSDALVAELETADVIVIGAPIYNFSIPASLKAWIDLVARAGRTFRYSADGPVGLLTGKRAVVAMASGGTRIGSELDYSSDYLRHVLGFLGIHDVTVVTSDGVVAAATDVAQAA